MNPSTARQTRIILGIIVAGALALTAYTATANVPADHYGIVTSHGQLQGFLQPGLHPVSPFDDVEYKPTANNFIMQPSGITVKPKGMADTSSAEIPLNIVVFYKLNDISPQNAFDTGVYEDGRRYNIFQRELELAIREKAQQVADNHTKMDILNHHEDIKNEIKQRLEAEQAGLGITIKRVRLF